MKKKLTIREKSTLLTIITSFVPSIIIMVLGAIKTKYIINYLGSDLNGIYQLMIHLSSFVIFGDLGLSSLFKIAYYKTLTTNDYDKTTRIYNYSIIYFKKITFIMFLVSLFVSGLSVLFVDPGISKIQIVILQFLVCVPNIFSFYIGKEITLLCARQKEYIFSFIYNIVYIFRLILSIFIILNTNNLFYFLSIDMILTSICYLVIGKISKKDNREVLINTSEVDSSPIEYSKYLIPNKICNIIFNNVDIIVISGMLSNTAASIYTTYIYISNCLVSLETNIVHSVKNSLGNLYYSKDDYKSKTTNEVILVSSFIFTVICIPLTIGMKSFVTQIWINDSTYIVDEMTYLFFCLYFLFYSLSVLSILFEESIGSYKETCRISAIQAIGNIVLSIVLCKLLGLKGTVLATIIILAPFEIRKINKSLKMLNIKYSNKYIYSFVIISFFEILVSCFFIKQINVEGILDWMISMLIIVAVSVLINISLYCVLFKEFRNILLIIKKKFIIKQ